MRLVKIGTRRSQLALWQAEFVRDALLKHHDNIEVELVGITSQGDKTLDIPLSQVGGKGLFLKELEEAILDRRVDIAVHSMKDVTVNLPQGLHIPVICVREDPRDAFVSNRYSSITEMEAQSVVGTCSLRRQAAIRHYFPQLEARNLRGTVNTRLARLDAGDYDGLILAAAGLKRLEMFDRICQELTVDLFLPAVGQGAVGIECRVDDPEINDLIAPLHHMETAYCVLAERSLNASLDGGCHVPVAAYAQIIDDKLSMKARVGDPDGSCMFESAGSSSLDEGEDLGASLADQLLSQGAGKILQQVYAKTE